MPGSQEGPREAAQWRLRIEDHAGRPMQLTLDELKRRPRTDRTVTFECGGNRDAVLNRMVSTCTWTGASLRDLLRDARPADDVVDVGVSTASRSRSMTARARGAARAPPQSVCVDVLVVRHRSAAAGIAHRGVARDRPPRTHAAGRSVDEEVELENNAIWVRKIGV